MEPTAKTKDATTSLSASLERLAENLHFSMERFAPDTADGRSWSELAPYEKEFYRACVRELLLDRRSITSFLLESGTMPTTTIRGRQGRRRGEFSRANISLRNLALGPIRSRAKTPLEVMAQALRQSNGK